MQQGQKIFNYSFQACNIYVTTQSPKKYYLNQIIPNFIILKVKPPLKIDNKTYLIKHTIKIKSQRRNTRGRKKLIKSIINYIAPHS
jgi:hypothetical protein